MGTTRRHGWTPITAPGPEGGEMLRSFGAIRANPLGFLESSWHTFGDVVQFPIPVPPTFLITHPDGVRRVLQANHKAYGKATVQYRNLALVTGEGLLAADTPAWRRQRKVVQPAFHPRAVMSVADHTVAAAERRAAIWSQAGARPGVTADSEPIVDVDEEMMRTALEVVGAALFGADLQRQSAALVAATQEALAGVVMRTRNPLPLPMRVPTRANRALRRAVARLNRLVAELVSNRRRQPPPSEPVDMLDVLLAADTLSEREVRDQVVTFIVAGHETVASSLTWTWYLLGQHPDVADQVAKEADAVYGARPPTFADVPALNTAMSVSDESLRLYPPGWLISRKSIAPDDVQGHHLPTGSLVLISPYLVHRHPSAGADRLEFRPERFATGPPPPVNGTYIPFGAGPRLCIGREMARVESALMVSRLAQQFKLQPTSAAPARVDPMVMLKPRGGLLMRVVARSSPGV